MLHGVSFEGRGDLLSVVLGEVRLAGDDLAELVRAIRNRTSVSWTIESPDEFVTFHPAEGSSGAHLVRGRVDRSHESDRVAFEANEFDWQRIVQRIYECAGTTSQNRMDHTYAVDARWEGRFLVLTCAAVPGAISQALTLEEAGDNMREAISWVLGIPEEVVHVVLHVRR